MKDFFTFTKGERQGLFVLLSLMVLLILFNFLYPLFLSHKQYDFTAYDREVNDFLKSNKDSIRKNKKQFQKEDFNILDAQHSVSEQSLNPFSFDPNTMTQKEWSEMGLTNKQIKVIENYKAKGGKYFDKEDFRKMYCISASEYEILEPFIDIKIVKPDYSKKEVPKRETSINKVEINTAGFEELLKIKGIGNYFATQIIDYRTKLGGYYNVNQLLEIPKMDTSRLHPLLPYLEVNPKAIRKINVNKADLEQLKKHPYMGYNIALSLINYRTKHGNFGQLSDIKKSMLITDAVYSKISMYLCVE